MSRWLQCNITPLLLYKSDYDAMFERAGECTNSGTYFYMEVCGKKRLEKRNNGCVQLGLRINI